MSHEGVTVHEEGAGVREKASQLIEDGKPVRVDVAPVKKTPVVQPAGPGEHLEPVARAENDHAARSPRKRQEVDLVFGAR